MSARKRRDYANQRNKAITEIKAELDRDAGTITEWSEDEAPEIELPQKDFQQPDAVENPVIEVLVAAQAGPKVDAPDNPVRSRPRIRRAVEADGPLITMAEAARRLCKHHTTIRRWVDDGLLVGVFMPSGIPAIPLNQINQLLRASAMQREV